MKLLVNAPTGEQQLIEVGEGGGYFDASRVLWDTRTDGPLPEIELGGMVREGNVIVFNQLRMDASTAAMTPAVPTQVTMRQARLALLGAGLLDTVETAIMAAGPAAKIEWEYAQEVQRASGLVPAMAIALGMTEAQIDALFVTAATL